MFPTVEHVEEYFQSVEELVFSSMPELPHVREAVYRIWVDVSRFGPSGWSSLPEMIPGLGNYEVPPPPPPPPPQSAAGWLDRSMEWVGEHPWATGGLVVGVVGAGLLVGHSVKHAHLVKVRRTTAQTAERRQVVVVLGGDTPLALPLILELESKGYIVIASVASPDVVHALEQRCHGYVRALVLDPTEPGTVPVFLRSLKATLSRRFPLNAAGDPHVSPLSHAYVHSVISLLTLPTLAPVPAPLEHLSLPTTYLAYLQLSHIVPLQVIQALLPLLRTMPPRARDEASNHNSKKTIVVCLPAPDTRVGLPFTAAQAMSAAATLRGIEVLRREINTAALTDPSESMKHIKVVVVDVGDVGVAAAPLEPHDAYRAMEHWTAAEKVTYGPAFGALVQPEARAPHTGFWSARRGGYGVPREPTNTGVFVRHIVGVVSGGRDVWAWRPWLCAVGPGLGRVRNWIRGERFAVGAGANTYRLASYLPSYILDALLNLPSVLISIRNRLLPVQPRLDPNAPLGPATAPPAPITLAPSASAAVSETEQDAEASETASEADVEGGSIDGSSGAESTWVSLGKRGQREAQAVDADA